MTLHWLRWLDWRVWYWACTDHTGWRNIFCRMRGHQAGVVWYDPTGSEPDMHCRNCDEDLG
jgi:hypothetical protein